MKKILKNTTGSPIELEIIGLEVPASSQIEIDPQYYDLLASNDSITELTTLINAGSIVVNNGNVDLQAAEGIKFLEFFTAERADRQFIISPTNTIVTPYQLSVQADGDACIEVLSGNSLTNEGAFFCLEDWGDGGGRDRLGIYNWQGGKIQFHTDTSKSSSQERVTIENSGEVRIHDLAPGGVVKASANGTLSVPAGIDDLSDVDTTTDTPNAGDRLEYDGSNWIPVPQSVAVSVSAPFSPWQTKSYTSDPIPFVNTDIESQPGLHDNTINVSSTATSGTSTALTDTGQSWTVNEWQNGIVKITGGTGSGQWRQITSNTSDTLTVGTWDITPDNTSTYEITLLASRLVAPQTGNYIITAHASIDYNAGVLGIFFFVNGVFKALHFTHQGQTVELNGQITKMLPLNVNDYVEMKVYNGDGSNTRQLFGGSARLFFQMNKV